MILLAGCHAHTDPPPPTSHALANPATATAPASGPGAFSEAIARGVAFLEKSQNADGSWGTGTVTRGTEAVAMVPGSHDAFRLGTTALCVMALREARGKAAHDRGVEYLAGGADARRDDGTLLYNTWAHVYVLQAMAGEMNSGAKDPRVAEVARRNLKHLVDYATLTGGWNYYDFHDQTATPGSGPTSFETAAGLVALSEARAAGLDVPQRLVDLSLHRLGEMREPNGVFLYGTDFKYLPRLPANMPRGAAGRTQPANYALWLWKAARPTPAEVVASLDLFVADHPFLEMGRKRPFPHEAWYQTSGYYYYFDHYYAALLLEALPRGGSRAAYARQLAAFVLPHQEPDGSWWDYAMWDYHKPYGTAFAILTLLRCEAAS